MSETQQKELGKILWAIAEDLRGTMNADDFRDYMLSFLFLVTGQALNIHNIYAIIQKAKR